MLPLTGVSMSRRHEGRTSVEIAGRCLYAGAASFPVYVSDLSLNGCRLFCADQLLRDGDRVAITLASLDPLPAQLRWIERVADGMFAGAQFEVALHPALLDHFAAYCRIAG